MSSQGQKDGANRQPPGPCPWAALTMVYGSALGYCSAPFNGQDKQEFTAAWMQAKSSEDRGSGFCREMSKQESCVFEEEHDAAEMGDEKKCCH